MFLLYPVPDLETVLPLPGVQPRATDELLFPWIKDAVDVLLVGVKLRADLPNPGDPDLKRLNLVSDPRNPRSEILQVCVDRLFKPDSVLRASASDA